MHGFLDVSQAFDKVYRPASQNQKLFPAQSIRNYKIIYSTKNLQAQIWRSGHAIKGDQLWSYTR